MQPSLVHAIAFHLPQFHPIPENDEWWGKGFTEWTNVVRAKPWFEGHYQPHLPADLGFYDLRLTEARAAQAALAAEYGIYGFCYYHYWFNGRRILERPVKEILESGEPDFPFCLCWANENWTRRWDGMEQQILLKQEYSADDDLAHIRALIPYLADRRYIRVQGYPFLLVYRPMKLPEPRRTAELWRREAERAGLGGLFLGWVGSSGETGDPQKIGFDCLVQFQPHAVLPWTGPRVLRSSWWHRHRLGTGETVYSENHVLRYADLVERALAEPESDYVRIPCVCPGWDNSPRRKNDVLIFVDSTPELYERWLAEIVNRCPSRAGREENGTVSPDSILFINAWNEWAEGNHLEPCQRWGRKYLEATKRALAMAVAEACAYANR